MKDIMRDELGAPKIVDRSTFQAELDALRVREKAHTREGDAIAAARRRLPMVEVDGATPLIGEGGAATLLDAFEGRQMLIAYYFMWHADHPAREQCEGCTWVTSQVRELSYIHIRDVTFAVFCQGPYEESARYRAFMGWDIPWYSAQGSSLDVLLTGRRVGMMHIVCYLRQRSNVFETYWTTIRGVEAMDNNYRLLDLTVYGRQETWEDSPTGWPQGNIMDTLRTNGRPTPPVVSPESRVFGRPGKRQALNRADQYLDLVPKGGDEEGFKSPVEWVRRHEEYAADGSLDPRWIRVLENAMAHVGWVPVEETPLPLLSGRSSILNLLLLEISMGRHGKGGRSIKHEKFSL